MLSSAREFGKPTCYNHILKLYRVLEEIEWRETSDNGKLLQELSGVLQ